MVDIPYLGSLLFAKEVLQQKENGKSDMLSVNRDKGAHS